ncbi:MAG TPA: ATP-binding protein, partial [Burkholderiales bacterium]|nr:ATP-binding protein [Burkholderiales bacterium]
RSPLGSPLARRLIVGIVLVSSAITLVLTALQLYSAYRGELRDLDGSFRQVERVHQMSIAQALWSTNVGLLNLQLQGLVRLPHFEHVEVREGGKLWASAGQRRSRELIERRLPLTYAYRGEDIEIGTLTLVAGLDDVYRHLLGEALVLLAGNALKTFVVAVFAFLFFHWLINRHLLGIAAYLRGLDVRGKPAPLALARRARSRPDELDELAAAINDMARNAGDAVRALHESEARLRLAGEAANAGLWERDLRSRRVMLSPEYLRRIGYAPGELSGDADEWATLIHPEDRARVLATLQDCIEGRIPSYEAEYRLRHKDGSYRWFLSRGAVLRGDTDRRARLLGVLIDVTERRRADAAREALEAQLRQAQKMEALGNFAGGIAHDINNVLGAVLGNAELARQDAGPGHPAQESLAEIRRAALRARDLIQQILAFSRQQQPERRVLSVREVIDDCASLIRATLPPGVELSVDAGPDAPNVLADRAQLHQVLMNLCSNAWQALEGRPGRVSVRFEDAQLGLDNAGLSLPPGRYLHLSVTDTGKGIDEATRARIFEPFFTTKPVGEGTGMGLAVVDGIVSSYGGAIRVESAPGRGAAFHVYLPAAEGEPEPRPAPSADLPRGHGERILYVDDEEALVTLVTRLLTRQGYAVSGFTGADEALAAVHAAPGDYDLVITDLNMPGTSGLELAREVLRAHPDLPVAVTSGYITDELHDEAARLGVREVIYKPNTVDEMTAAIHRVLESLRA